MHHSNPEADGLTLPESKAAVISLTDASISKTALSAYQRQDD